MNKAIKYGAIGVLSIVGIAHIGLLGYVIRRPADTIATVPTINIPRGPYSSYKIKAGKDGYEIEYRSDDPKVLQSERSLDLDKERRGVFGGGREQRTEYRRDQYTREGTRNIGGAIDDEGKLSAKNVECIVADAGAQSQGAMAGTSIAAGVLVPAVSNIPYVGWLASGWALLLGQNLGSAAGSTVNSMISDC
jgi:hypothetical protein|tara:strand:+ start:215 stop:790 length:576 start_codon:yes stop_codon:yes gene_type:complete